MIQVERIVNHMNYKEEKIRGKLDRITDLVNSLRAAGFIEMNVKTKTLTYEVEDTSFETMKSDSIIAVLKYKSLVLAICINNIYIGYHHSENEPIYFKKYFYIESSLNNTKIIIDFIDEYYIELFIKN